MPCPRPRAKVHKPSAVLGILEAEGHRLARELGVTYAQWAESSHEALELAMTCYFISDWLATLPGL